MRGPAVRAAAKLIGVACIVVGVLAMARHVIAPIGMYDEGILLTDADLVLRGAFPYRDFYTNYPPAVFWLVALVWKLGGVSVLSERMVGAALHAFTAVLAGRIGGLLAGRRFSLFTCGVVFLWSGHQPIWPMAFATGLTALLAAIVLTARAHVSGSPRDWALAGVAAAIVGCFRHDLFVYMALAVVLALVVQRLIVRERILALPRGSALIAFAVSLLVPLVLNWGWIFTHAGIDAPLHDIGLDQARYVAPARVLPWPSFAHIKAFQIAFVLVLSGPLIIAAAWKLWNCRASALLLGVACFAAVPQMLSRWDEQHVQAALTPALIAACALVLVLLERSASVPGRVITATCGLGVLVAGACSGLRFAPNTAWVRVSGGRWGIAREEDAALADARRRVVAFVAEHARPDEGIFVGCRQHAVTEIDEVELYFLADRPGATRRLQFDPATTDRDDVQAGMVADFEARRTPVMVLSDRWSAKPHGPRGSTRLDAYIRSRYVLAETAGPYELWLRAR
jgi:hypothetical protein